MRTEPIWEYARDHLRQLRALLRFAPTLYRRSARTELLHRHGWYRSAVEPHGRRSIVLMVNAGEILGITRFCETLRALFPEHTLIIAVDNRDAYALGQRLRIADAVVYSPWDTKRHAGRMAQELNVELAVFLFKVFHPRAVAEWQRRGIVVGMVSGYAGAEMRTQRAWKQMRTTLRRHRTYDAFAFLTVQTNGQKRLLRKLFAMRRKDVATLGNIRYDMRHCRVTPAEKRQLYRMVKLSPKAEIIVAAATRDDEDIILDAYAKIVAQRPMVKLALIPRYPERTSKIIQLAEKRGLTIEKLSTLRRAPRQIVIGDHWVDLGKLYSIANVVIFARTFRSTAGAANILEPASHGKPIVFGDKLKLFRPMLAGIRRRYPQVEVRSAEQLARSVLHFLTVKKSAADVGKRYRQLVQGGERIAIRNARFVHTQYLRRGGNHE